MGPSSTSCRTWSSDRAAARGWPSLQARRATQGKCSVRVMLVDGVPHLVEVVSSTASCEYTMLWRAAEAELGESRSTNHDHQLDKGEALTIWRSGDLVIW